MNPSVPRAWSWGSLADHLQRSSDWIIWSAEPWPQIKPSWCLPSTDHHTEGCDKSANDLSQVQSGVSGFSFLSFCVECYPMLSKHIQAYENQLVTGPWGRCMRLGIQKWCITLRLYWREMSWGFGWAYSVTLATIWSFFQSSSALVSNSSTTPKQRLNAFEIKFLSSIGL